MKNTIKIILVLSILLIASKSFAKSIQSDAPLVKDITQNSATIYANTSLTSLDQTNTQIYFEIYQKDLVCPAIYPTPEYCLPKISPKGVSIFSFTNLKPNTTYTTVQKRDTTVYCVTSPCPTNEYRSTETKFTTLSETSGLSLSKNLYIGMRDNQINILQNMLTERGYFSGTTTNYFGLKTFKAVKQFQKDNTINPTGFIGPKTRNLLNTTNSNEIIFTGKIENTSTGCFIDAVCSVTVSGKTIITGIGWTPGPVGIIKNSTMSDLENKIGSLVKVYAKKTSSEYTLYGDTKYYIELLQ